MKKENSISFNTNHTCSSCDNGHINAKFVRHEAVFRVGPLIVGGRNSVKNITDTSVVYFCTNCGHVFLPTKNNHLDEKFEDFEKTAKALFQKTKPRSLNRNLSLGEVFEEVLKDDTESDFIVIDWDNDLSLFKEDFPVRVIIDNDKFSGMLKNDTFLTPTVVVDLKEFPYLVSSDSAYKLIWWAKQIRKEVPLTKEERSEKLKTLKARLSKLENERDRITENNKNGSFKQKISASVKIEIPSVETQIKTLKSATKLVLVDNEPLPEGAEIAELVMIIDPNNNKRRGFYIPKISIV